jgi:hypothetical protein
MMQVVDLAGVIIIFESCHWRKTQRSILAQPVQTVASAEASDLLSRVVGYGAIFANPDEFFHCLPSLVLPTDVTLMDSSTHEFGDCRLLPFCVGLKDLPEVIIQVQLHSPHAV